MLLVNAETWSHRGYFEKIRVFKAGLRLNILAWNNTIGLLSYLVGLGMAVMIKRNSWGPVSYTHLTLPTNREV